MDTSTLTKRERAVFDRLVTGKTNAEIGTILGITEKTVKAHVTEIFRKTGTKRREQVIVAYYKTIEEAQSATVESSV